MDCCINTDVMEEVYQKLSIRQVREKLYDLRLWMVQNMNDKIPVGIKTGLFKEMWLQNSERYDELADIFWNGEMPVDLQWLRRKGKIEI